jgi:O-methyltransferase involved in polyketide biosynthesis
MDSTQQPNTNARDYDAISPSAKSLLLLKGITNIPFARETAELISLPGKYEPDINNKDFAFWKRVVHFENRYWSVDQLLSHLSIHNILELCSGYSFRGLQTVTQKKVHYIDTDLVEVINQKKNFLNSLQENITGKKGNLETIPLNALDEKKFIETVDRFDDGPIVIVNEGLLMYLNNEEKVQLCKIIHGVLKQRGGYWITGDIYIKSTMERLDEETDDSLKELIEKQRIEDNMFESFDVAEKFFKKLGFVIDKDAEPDFAKVSSLKYLLSNATEVQLMELNTSKKIQATWCMKLDGGF